MVVSNSICKTKLNESVNLGASFHTIPHIEIMQNYVVGDFGKVYLVDGEALDVIRVGDVQIILPNINVGLCKK